jgi:soluble lytic murein transglycosylase
LARRLGTQLGRGARLALAAAIVGFAALALGAAWRNSRLADLERVERWSKEIRAAASEAGVDPYLLAGLVYAESRGKPDAVSSAGAEGLCQIKPATARELAQQLRLSGDPPFPPAQNLRLGARYLSQNIRQWGQNEDLGLLCYRLGPGRVAREVEAAGSPEAYLANLEAEEAGVWAYCRQIHETAERLRARNRILAPTNGGSQEPRPESAGS